MQNLFFFFFFFLSLLFSFCSSVAGSNSRRILHEPFVPLEPHPPTDPPKPPPSSNTTTNQTTPQKQNPKHPSSTATTAASTTTATPTTTTTTTTTTTPYDSPFFPNYPSQPPPPPQPTFTGFASFPANISSLILPHSPTPTHSNSKLLPVALSAVACAVVAAAVSAFFYLRRRRRNRGVEENKDVRPECTRRRETAAKHRQSPTAAGSEFLYLGTVVNSRRVEGGGSGGGGDVRDNRASLSRKLESPELRPLPPLVRQISAPPVVTAAQEEAENEEEEESEMFYSPRGSSLGGRESSGGTGSGSRRALSTIAGENFGELSSCSVSSSNSGSPERCHSICISPPAHRPPPPQQQTVTSVLSPTLSPIHNQHVSSSGSSSYSSSLCSSACATPERGFVEDEEEEDTNSNSNAVNVTESPLLSPLSLPPNRDSEEKTLTANLDDSSSSPQKKRVPETHEAALPRNSNVSNGSRKSSSSAASPRVSNGSRKPLSRSTSLDRVLKASEVASLASSRISSSSNASRKSKSLSQERNLETNKVATASALPFASPPRLSNVSSNGSTKFVATSPSSSAFSLPSSPEKARSHNGFDQSPRMSSVSDQFRQPGLSSVPLSPSLLSSPETERGFNFSASFNSSESATLANGASQRKHWEIPALSTTTTNPFGRSGSIGSVLDQIVAVPVTHPPPVPPQRKQWAIPDISTPLAPPPPPPPPPPATTQQQRQRKQWEVPSPTTPVGQSVSRPPELRPPSRPFVLQNTTLVSPVELPPSSQGSVESEEAAKPKLKPLHWDKVRASSDREMVWDQLKTSSFKLNEEMIETLFVANMPNSKQMDSTSGTVLPQSSQEEKVLDPRKSQNIAILLRALNVTIEEVCEALLEGSADTLGAELLESLLKMAPSKEEERKLKEYNEDSPNKLGPAEKFLKALLDVPFAFKRVEAMLYIVNFDSEVEYLRKSFQALEAACEELRSSRMFLKLLEAVLKTGNRMNVGTNRGDAQAFKLDTLLKLADVKGADGKTTLLHFVVQEIIRTEGARLSNTNQTPNSSLAEDVACRRLGLQVVSSLSSELASVKKAATMDSEVLSNDASKLSKGIANIAEVVRLNEKAGSNEKFTESMNKFIRMAEEEILKIQAQENVALTVVKEITEYFHGDLAKEEAHPFRIFMVVRDFLAVLDRVCREVGMINERTMVSSAHRFPVPVNPMLPQPVNPMLPQPVNPMLQHSDSSDDDTPSS